MTSSGARITPVDDSIRSTISALGLRRLRGDAHAPTGQQPLQRPESDQHIHHRRGSHTISGRQHGGAEDLDHGVVSTLRIGAWEFRCGCIGSELGGSCDDVLGELRLDEPLEDPRQLRGHHAGATGRVNPDRVVDRRDRGRAPIVGQLVVALGAVEVGEGLPPPHHDAEVVEREMLGVLEQDRRDRVELRANPRVRCGARHLVRLCNADVAIGEGIAQGGHDVECRRELAQPRGLAARAVGLGSDPLLHRPMPVDGVQSPALARAHDAGHLGLDGPTLQLEFPEPLRQRLVVGLGELLDKAEDMS
jgi:hypothetical protein